MLALIWANLAPDSYHQLVHLSIWSDAPIGLVEMHDGQAVRVLTLHFLINDLLMALFFAMAAKGVWEAVILSDGSLRGKKALTPLIATLGVNPSGPVVAAAGLDPRLKDALRDIFLGLHRDPAQAEALRMQRESITPELIRLREVEARIKAIEKWDGKMPQVSGGAVPFINVQPEAR